MQYSTNWHHAYYNNIPMLVNHDKSQHLSASHRMRHKNSLTVRLISKFVITKHHTMHRKHATTIPCEISGLIAADVPDFVCYLLDRNLCPPRHPDNRSDSRDMKVEKDDEEELTQSHCFMPMAT